MGCLSIMLGFINILVQSHLEMLILKCFCPSCPKLYPVSHIISQLRGKKQAIRHSRMAHWTGLHWTWEVDECWSAFHSHASRVVTSLRTRRNGTAPTSGTEAQLGLEATCLEMTHTWRKLLCSPPSPPLLHLPVLLCLHSHPASLRGSAI